jgi:predicted SAM-dependent methyltransferase
MLRKAARRALAPALRRRGEARLRRAIGDAPPPYRVELGAGRAARAGWLCTDVSWRARYVLDAAGPWPFPDASASHVYADNMIEHVRLDAARRLFEEARRVLADAGTLRLATPDVEGTARLYLLDVEGGDAHLDRHRSHGYRVEHRVDLLNLTYLESGHAAGYLYDFDALRDELLRAGFRRVLRVRSGESDDPVLRGLEQRLEPTDELASLVVEATR